MRQIESNFDASVLCGLFDSLFGASHHTQLVGGAVEPLYQPGEDLHQPHYIKFNRDYFASALHEVAHWCIAGPVRRRQVDYGYWYQPDGRDAEQQQAFEKVEVKPQALEWIFCVAAGFPFRISADNLNGAGRISETFKKSIWRQTQVFCQSGLPERGRQFAEALQQTFAGGDFRDPANYRRGVLR